MHAYNMKINESKLTGGQSVLLHTIPSHSMIPRLQTHFWQKSTQTSPFLRKTKKKYQLMLKIKNERLQNHIATYCSENNTF